MKTLITQTLIASGIALSALSPVYAAEQGKEPLKAVGQYVDDATITTKVKAKHAEEKTVSALRDHGETKQGVVGVVRRSQNRGRDGACTKRWPSRWRAGQLSPLSLSRGPSRSGLP